MRKIKFRAWDVINKKMYPVAYPTWNGATEGKIDFISHTVETIDEDGDDKPIVMQFTGIQDQYGKDIYEGDIINTLKNCLFDEGTHNRTVIFHNGCFVAQESLVPIGTICGGFKSRVIGNIYETPELLTR